MNSQKDLSTTDRLRALKNELNAIKNSNLTDSEFINTQKVGPK